MDTIRPCEIRYVDFGSGTQCFQGGIRPALISQNEIGCKCSPIIRVIPLTSKINKCEEKRLPMHVYVPKSKQNGLKCDSIALTEQERFVLRGNIGEYIGIMEVNVVHQCGLAIIKNGSLFPPEIVRLVEKMVVV